MYYRRRESDGGLVDSAALDFNWISNFFKDLASRVIKSEYRISNYETNSKHQNSNDRNSIIRLTMWAGGRFVNLEHLNLGFV